MQIRRLSSASRCGVVEIGSACLCRHIVESHHAHNARVYGSVLHGEDTDSSDLDILIDPTPETTLFDIGAIRHELGKLLGVPVDVLTPNALTDKFRAAAPDFQDGSGKENGARKRRFFCATAARAAADGVQTRRRRAAAMPARPRPSSARDIGSGTGLGFTGSPDAVAAARR